MRGLACNFGHSPEEVTCFKLSGGKSPFTRYKTKPCANRYCITGTDIRKRCTWLHEDEEHLCLECLEHPCRFDCKATGKAPARDILTKKSPKYLALKNDNYLL